MTFVGSDGLAMHYLIYCDESDDKGEFYSNFYGGAILRANDREAIEKVLIEAKGPIGEAKWTKISQHNEQQYITFIDALFDLVRDGRIKLRIMFTQNINQTRHVNYYDEENKFFILYYQFLKHAFGLRYCNPDGKNDVHVSVYVDDAPDTDDRFDNFKDYLSSLSTYPIFFNERIRIRKSDITEVDSKSHVILQAVDVVLGSIQFRLNELHRKIEGGKRHRGKRTRAKDRVYRCINRRIRQLYPGFNIGTSTGQADGPKVKWSHPYRHWCFKPTDSVEDLARGKRQKRAKK